MEKNKFTTLFLFLSTFFIVSTSEIQRKPCPHLFSPHRGSGVEEICGLSNLDLASYPDCVSDNTVCAFMGRLQFCNCTNPKCIPSLSDVQNNYSQLYMHKFPFFTMNMYLGNLELNEKMKYLDRVRHDYSHPDNPLLPSWTIETLRYNIFKSLLTSCNCNVEDKICLNISESDDLFKIK
ncbi:hypothetical protein LbFV_ORF62 [Leptopilina boulardi filamentous virus]|uniref:Uncharacterized protein n=1 Tax=Leptopilina boulardi filamentous virus TaxID=552509 RepID=A0A1S5YD37_9VIRU|nr:hypothetical protein LbFV_ORF62 [Leptopilina boulardi filamentous virus]AQQ79982.1 hypothetical protein LbFV_ORF62 [Leptopilina boulardi filamentous virus]